MTTPIVALDVSSLTEALSIIERLGDACDFYKVGGQLFAAEGPQAVRALRSLGRRVFVDLKLHDIPNTVSHAVGELAGLDVELLTVHASGGEEMLRAATAAAGAGCGVLCVTVLTSLDEPALGVAWGKPIARVTDEVLRLARLADRAGAHGIVCSGHELGAVRDEFGDRLATLVPGIRFAGGDSHDQSRVMTPARAGALGASYIVLGRAVTGATDPRAAMQRVDEDLAASRSQG